MANEPVSIVSVSLPIVFVIPPSNDADDDADGSVSSTSMDGSTNDDDADEADDLTAALANAAMAAVFDKDHDCFEGHIDARGDESHDDDTGGTRVLYVTFCKKLPGVGISMWME